MALVDHDSWEIEYEGCERLHHQLLVQLHQRQQVQQPLSPEYVKHTTNIQAGLDQLRKDVSHIKVVLENAETWETCTPEELQRRRRVLDKLTSQLREVSEKFTNSSRADRAAATSTSLWQDTGNTGEAAKADIPTDTETFKRRKAEILAEQNRGLDVLSATLARQRETVIAMGNEVDNQNNILDNLNDNMDRVQSGVQRETQSIGLVSRRDSTWGYWLIIIGLFISIVIVALV